MSDVVVYCVLFVDVCSLFDVFGVLVSIMFFVLCVCRVLFVVRCVLCVV